MLIICTVSAYVQPKRKTTSTPKCSECGSTDLQGLQVRGVFQCLSCDAMVTGPSQSARNRERSQSQERRNAHALGGRVTRGSGAVAHDKGDVTTTALGKYADTLGYRLECKSTQAASYALKLDLLHKIERETRGSETPVFTVEFVTPEGHRFEYYIFRKPDAVRLMRNGDE